MEPNVPINGKKIMVVEDDYINMLFISRFLEINGYEVLQAYNGKEALDKYEKNDVAFIFMDIQMPIMDGFTATVQIRQLEKSKACRVPIVALTAYVLTEDRIKCFDAGMDDFISKPVDINELKRKLNQWLT